MSFCAMPTSAANSAVKAPTAATTVSTPGAASISGNSRATRNTPAATIVAAWISADTGVGPSIASGSQVWSGNCPDLPTAPQNTSSPIQVETASPPTIPAAPNRPSAPASRQPAPPSNSSSVPASRPSHRIPNRNPMSPTRVVRNALRAASAAASRSNQKPISR